MDTFVVTLPALLLSSVSALPLGIGLLAAARHLRADRRSAYLRNLHGSIAAGAVVLLVLWGPLFGDDLSGSSTAALIFLFAPVYAAAAQGVVYGISAAATRRAAAPGTISSFSRGAILIPLSMLAVLTTGLVTTAVVGNDLAVAERGWNAGTLHRLFARSQAGDADSFGVPLMLTQNPNTPPEILVELAKHSRPVVRVHVAKHPRTPDEVVAGLGNDCSSFVRNAVRKRLGSTEAPPATAAPTGVCAAERER
jgi:hypothetical protein